MNTDGVVSESDVIDHKGSMQGMRDIYNPHTHNAPNGVTANPNEAM